MCLHSDDFMMMLLLSMMMMLMVMLLIMTMVMPLLMMIDDDDVDAWETDTRRHHYLPWESLRPHITYFFLFANKLLMKII